MLGFSSVASAGWFGPSNYDECILEGVKDAKTTAAASLVAQACRNKFPPKQQQAPISTPTPTPNYDYLRVDFYDDKTGKRENWNLKIKVVSTQSKKTYTYGTRKEVRAMNSYSIPVQAIKIGVINPQDSSSSCPDNFSGYSQVVSCRGYAGAREAGNFECDDFSGSYCITGFLTSLVDTDKTIKQLRSELNGN